MYKILLALSVIILSGCANGQTKTKLICPPIQKYSRESQNKLAGELVKLPNESETLQYIFDYQKLRAKLKICNPKNK